MLSSCPCARETGGEIAHFCGCRRIVLGRTVLEQMHHRPRMASALQVSPQVMPSGLRRRSEPVQLGKKSSRFSAAAGNSKREKANPGRLLLKASLAEKEAPVVAAGPGGSSDTVTYKVRVAALRKKNPNFVADFIESSVDAIRGEVQERLDAAVDSVADFFGQRIFLQLISEEIDPKTKVGKRSAPSHITDWLAKSWGNGTDVEYSAELKVAMDFGNPGAVVVVNSHKLEVYIKTISLAGPRSSQPCHFLCDSLVYRSDPKGEGRVFFRNRPFLPRNTPPGLRDLRNAELAALRGDGTGLRQSWDRIYDYDVYNDLGDSDASLALARPTLGGNAQFPYPRRCRTGRPPSTADPSKESRLPASGKIYVPSGEAFDDVKQADFVTGNLKSLAQQYFVTKVEEDDTPEEFDVFDDIDKMYKYAANPDGWWDKLLGFASSLFKIEGEVEMDSWLEYSSPLVLEGDKFRWMRDDEFGRQVLAGVNPVTVERLKVFPPESSLDPSVYGATASALTAEHLEKNLEGLTVQQAIEQKRLYIIDYHDAFLPYVGEINCLPTRKAYAPRVIFFSSEHGTFKPVAIELSLPPQQPGSEGHKQVFTPGWDATSSWRWLLAKAHFCAVDAGIHQLGSHWLRTHACTEPYVMATHRQLSSLHPVYKLLSPHLRYTMKINAAARQSLINAAGAIEQIFTPGQYAMQISSTLYKLSWRFDNEGLPADLIRRGMAEETADGLKLVIEDYPYAADGLLIWDAIKGVVEEYLSLYYSDSYNLKDDSEVQAWWHEIKTVGHADKQQEPWWPELNSREDLVGVVATIIWVASAQHAAVNFGQYAYGGYVPNKPTMARRLIPQEQEDPSYRKFLENPEKFFLTTLPNKVDAIKAMSTVSLLSTHSRDEEYIGQRRPHWTDDESAVSAFQKFDAALESIEAIINSRNQDTKFKLRHGAGTIPYELLHPRSLIITDEDGKQRSVPGITGRGVPNSISI